jgi:hypothetical protein
MYVATWYRVVSKGGSPSGIGASAVSGGSGVGVLGRLNEVEWRRYGMRDVRLDRSEHTLYRGKA